MYSATPENESYSGSHSTSSDGRYVVFLSNGRNVVDGQIDTNEGYDIFVFDRLTQTTRLVSGAENSTTQTGNNPSRTATISANGRFIVFTSTATNLVLEQVDTNADRDVFVFDQIEGTTRLIS
ncbi:MAG TPA: calcium-binding protein, partial [Acidobacteriota bacterium]|nr:calcium-binding protein [Acidobacteriota bacterium]